MRVTRPGADAAALATIAMTMGGGATAMIGASAPDGVAWLLVIAGAVLAAAGIAGGVALARGAR